MHVRKQYLCLFFSLFPSLPPLCPCFCISLASVREVNIFILPRRRAILFPSGLRVRARISKTRKRWKNGRVFTSRDVVFGTFRSFGCVRPNVENRGKRFVGGDGGSVCRRGFYVAARKRRRRRRMRPSRSLVRNERVERRPGCERGCTKGARSAGRGQKRDRYCG